ASFSMSIVDVVDWGARPAGATALAGSLVGGIEKNQVARMPAPEMTAVDFQSMRRNQGYSSISSCYDSSCTLSDSRIPSTEHFPLHKSSPSSPLDTTPRVYRASP